MADDINHLEIRTIGTGDTFNDWRRITNSIGLEASNSTVTSSTFNLGDFDWTSRIDKLFLFQEVQSVLLTILNKNF